MARIKDSLLRRQERRNEPASLGDLVGAGLRVFCRCNRCSHTASLNARRLAEDLGAAFLVPEVGSKLRCTGCDSMDISTRPAWPGLPARDYAEDPGGAEDLGESEVPPGVLP